MSAALLRLTETGVIKTMVTERLSLADVPDGLRRLGAGTTTGRIVFIPDHAGRGMGREAKP